MKRDVVESLKFILGYDITDYQDLYDNSVVLGTFVSKEKAFKIKNRLEILASEFDWKKKFVVARYKYLDKDKAYSVLPEEDLDDDYVIVEQSSVLPYNW